MKYPTPSSYTKEIRARQDKTLKYFYFIDKEHPLASKGGKVYFHRHLASVKIGEWVDELLEVHHKDEDRTNNDFDNLAVLSSAEHQRIHHYKHGGFTKTDVVCLFCKKQFIAKSKIKFCSPSCSSSFLQKGGMHNKISKELLKRLVWKIPATRLGKIFGCSDVMIGRLCKRWDIEYPGRGYWAKIRSQRK
jgi:hypothetical protein